jgi:hypothetical protein
MKTWIQKILIGTGLLTALLSSARAQEVTLRTEPSIIRLGEQAQLVLTLKNIKDGDRPQPPKVDGLRFSAFNSSGTQMSIINGKMERSARYACRVLPERSGTFTIPLTYRADGKTRELKAQLKVLAGAETDGNAADLSELFFATLETGRTDRYVQEAFTLTLSLYSAREAQLTDQIDLKGMPESGFEETRWQQWQPLGRRQVERKGRIYNEQRFQITTRALTSGTFTLHPQITVGVAAPNQRRRRDPFGGGLFDDFFNRTRVQEIPVTVQPLKLEIKPLPQAERPADFSGAVGRFQLMVEGIPPEPAAGEPVTVKMMLQGAGNMDQITPPQIEAVPGLKVYDPSAPQTDGQQLIFEQVIIPRDPKLTEIPEITFSYFDVDAKAYRTLTAGPFPVQVQPGTGQRGAQVIQAEASTAPPPDRTLGEDIFYLKPLQKQTGFRPHNLPLWFGLPLLLNAVAWGFALHQNRLDADPAARRRRQAPKAARAALTRARRAMQEPDGRTFYAALLQAVTDCFAHRLNLPPGETDAAAVRERVRQSPLTPETLDPFMQILERCEISRYGPGADTAPEERRKELQTVEQFLKQCERVVFK